MAFLHPLLLGLGCSLLVVLCSYFVPEAWVTDSLGVLFIGLGYFFVTRGWGSPPTAAIEAAPGQGERAKLFEERLSEAGLLFGGILSRAPLTLGSMLGRLLRASWAASWVFILVAIPYSWVFWLYFEPGDHFSFAQAWCGAARPLFTFGPSAAFLELALAHLFAIALPEEFFFRGFLQPALLKRWGDRPQIWGGNLGWANVSVSLLFALGHYLTSFDPQRLAVFFPSLLFGWLADRRQSITSSVILHAQCNLLVIWLNQGWGHF